ncbi:MAG: hypothetical protein ABIK43_03700 [candidate division WOR-3 bacterium]
MRAQSHVQGGVLSGILAGTQTTLLKAVRIQALTSVLYMVQCQFRWRFQLVVLRGVPVGTR